MLFLRRALVGVLLSALTLGALAWAGASVWSAVTAVMGDEGEPAPRREIVQSVTAVEVVPQSAVPVVEAFGSVRSTRTLDLRAASAGQIVDLADPFRDGVEVTQGQVLVRIDPSEAEAGLASARADLDAARADLRDAGRGVTLAQDDLAVTQEQADLRTQSLARQRGLEDRGVGSIAAVEQSALESAQARQAVVSRRQALAQSEARLDQARTARDRAQIALGEAERLLADTTLTAPFTALLTDVAAVRGGLVARNDLLARLVDPTALEVSFRVSSEQFARLTEAGPLGADRATRVSLDLGSGAITSPAGDLRESPVVAEGQTGRALFARITDPRGLRPGDIVTVAVDEAPLTRVARLPTSAVAADGGVLVIGPEDRLIAGQVDILRRQGNTVLVRAPDLAGARIVADRNPSLGAGVLVRVTGAQDQGADQTAAADGVLIELTLERRETLIALVEADPALTAQDRDRMLGLLATGPVPAGMVSRLEQQRGG